jgi:hypothetical protein
MTTTSAVETHRHLHRCQNCGTIWGHGNMLVEDVEAHKCPKCGRSEWHHYSGGGAPAPIAKKQESGGTFYVMLFRDLLSVAVLVLAAAFLGQLLAEWLLAEKS